MKEISNQRSFSTFGRGFENPLSEAINPTPYVTPPPLGFNPLGGSWVT